MSMHLVRDSAQLAPPSGTRTLTLARWTALCAATRQIAEGQLVRTAAMDAGFADTAHLTRTFRTTFGTTPTLATADRR